MDLNEAEKRIEALENRKFELTEEQLTHIAEVAATKTLDKVYANFGKGVLERIIKWVGLAALAIAMYFAGKGEVPKL